MSMDYAVAGLAADFDHAGAAPARPADKLPEVRRECRDCRLHGLMVCSAISAQNFAVFQTGIDRLTIRRGEVLFGADMPAARVYFIRAGFVKLVRYSSSGGQRIVRIVKAGDVAGMEMLFSPSFENAAIAMGEVVACSIPATGFRRLIDDNPALQWRLLEHGHRALQAAEIWLSELAGGNAKTRERLARLLLCLRDGDSNRIHRFSLEDIGAILGICLETVCRVLAQFKREGLLTKDSAGFVENATMPFFYGDLERLQQAAEGRDARREPPTAAPSPVRAAARRR